MADTIYCGSGKEKFDGDLISISVCLEDIPEEFKKKHTNGKTYINLDVSKKREEDQWGKTHAVKVDTFKPTKGAGAQQVTPAPSGYEEVPMDSDLSF